MKKGIIFIAIIIAIIIIGYLIFNPTNKSDESDIVKIGAVLPLTGNIAEYGNYMKDGIELALSDAKQLGFENVDKIQLIFEDGKANPKSSVDAFNKLVEFDKITVGFSATSAVTLAMKPIANKNQVILMNASAISTEIEDKSDYMYSIIPNASYTGKYLAEKAYNLLNKRNAGILYRNDASGISFKDEFKKKFLELNGSIVYESAHQLNNTEFRSFILELKNVELLDVIFVASWGPEVAHFIKQAKEQNLNIQVLAYETFKSPKVLEIAGEAANGVIFSSPRLIELEDYNLFETFKEKVLEKFGSEEINYHILGHYDATMIVIKAISEGNITADRIKEYFDGMESYNGITGNIRFDKNGGSILSLGLYTVEDNLFRKLNL